MAPSLTFKVENVRQVLVHVDRMDKAAEKVIANRLAKAARQVVAAAKRRITGQPLSGWGAWTQAKDGKDLSFNPAAVAAGIKINKANFRSRGNKVGFAYNVRQTSAAGAIFEVIGSGSRVSGPAGARFVANVNAAHPGRQPRTLFPAYYDVMTPELAEQMRDDIVDAARRIGLK